MTPRPLKLLTCAALLGGPLWLGGCSSTLGTFSTSLGPAAPAPAAAQTAPLIDPNDDLELGKRHFAQTNYGLAEQHFRRAVERSTGPRTRDGEAWLGLAASYDRLRRFDLADRAYGQALAAVGPTPEVLNNQGYSFLLRKDYRRARAKLLLAREKDPGNAYISNNLVLLADSEAPRPRSR